jgi:hypothetical protein
MIAQEGKRDLVLNQKALTMEVKKNLKIHLILKNREITKEGKRDHFKRSS